MHSIGLRLKGRASIRENVSIGKRESRRALRRVFYAQAASRAALRRDLQAAVSGSAALLLRFNPM